MASTAELLKECLLSLTVRVREIRALSLVDRNGLPLVSTLGTGTLEETLAAFGGSITTQLDRAQRDFQMGPLYQAHIVGRDRQVFVTPVDRETALVAMVESHATATTITMHLLALSRQVAGHLAERAPAAAPSPAVGGDTESEPGKGTSGR